MSLLAAHPELLLHSEPPPGSVGPAPRTATTTLCTHCKLPVPAGLIRKGVGSSGAQFCCHGCETAYSVINSCGLDAYYTLIDRSDSERTPAKSTRRAYAEFDDPTFHSLYCTPIAGGQLRTELLLEGVHCAACVWLVEKLPRIVPGVVEARLNMRRASVAVTFDPAQANLSSIARALDSLGYAPHPSRGQGGSAARDARRVEDRKMLVRMAIAGACAGNIMLLFFALYAGMFEGIEHGYEQLFRWVAMALNTVCLGWPGLVFARSALAALRTRSIHLDVPIALGLYLGGGWGIYKTIAGTGDIYFDSVSALVFFLLVGRFIQQRQQRAAADAVELLFSLTPAIARKVICDPDHSSTPSLPVQEVPTEALSPNDIVEVRAGDSIPADGEIIRGQSQVDLSLLTGESRPMHVALGDQVAAGSVNLGSTILVRVQTIGESTRIGKLVRMIEDASRRRAAIVKLADRWGRWLLWALLALSAATLAIWWHVGTSIAIDHAIALLIATCPCGLGLATPMAMTVAIGRAARRGMLIKGGDALQSLAAPGSRGTIVLDKTGTITFGALALVRWHGDDEARPFLAAIESQSAHPIARALVRDLASHANPSLRVEHVTQHVGEGKGGLEATVDGHRVVTGTRRLIESCRIPIPPDLDGTAADALRDALSPVFVAVDDRCVAVAVMGDSIRPDALAAIAAFQSRGWRIKVLSGDHPHIVQLVARALNLNPADCCGGVSPESKLAVVRDLAARGPVIMIGDGVNDAAALAAATVGVAVRGGAEASLAAADISLSREGLVPIVGLFEGARNTMRTIHWTIASSLAYNVLAASLSMAGLISPLLAALIMPASSLTVVAICLGSSAFRDRRAAQGATL